MKWLKKYRENYLLGGIVVFAFLVRLIGIKFGYPLLTHPDESTILSAVVDMTANRTLDAGNSMRPDLFLIHIDFVILNLASFLKFGASIAVTFAENKLFFFYIARLIVAVIGAALPLVAWKIGKEGKLDFSLPAAVVFAFYPSYVEHSHYVTPDVTITFFTLLILLFSIRFNRTGTALYLYLATFVAALNTSEKYCGLISFGIVVAAILLSELRPSERPLLTRWQRAGSQIGKFGLLFLAFLFLVAPTLFIEYGRTIDEVINEARTTHLGGDNLGWLGNMAFYAGQFVRRGNWLLTLLGIPGIVYAVRQRDETFLFAAYGLLYWVLLSALALHWERWALPMYTAPLLFAAYGAAALALFLRRAPRLGRVVQYSVIGVLGLGLFLASFSQSVVMSYPDTRVAALEYCDQCGITRANSLFENYTPFSPTLEAGADFHEQWQSGAHFDYMILSSAMYDRYASDPQRYTRQTENYEEIRREYSLMAEFTPFSADDDSLADQWDALVYFVRRHFGFSVPIRYSGPVIQVYGREE